MDPQQRSIRTTWLHVHQVRLVIHRPPLDSENYIFDWGRTANGRNCAEVVFFQRVYPPAHNFDPDPHYRTVGQFLGSQSAALRSD
jgi:hypothetical protein